MAHASIVSFTQQLEFLYHSPGALLSSSGASKPRAMRCPMAYTMPERMGYALQPRCGTSRATCAPTVRGSLWFAEF